MVIDMDRDVLHYYNFNKDFHEYVKGYCRKHEIDVETALTHRPVLDACEYYKEAGKGKKSEDKE